MLFPVCNGNWEAPSFSYFKLCHVQAFFVDGLWVPLIVICAKFEVSGTHTTENKEGALCVP